MPDIAEGRSAVREATRRAEEAAGIFRDDQGNETYVDQTTPEATIPELEGAVPVAASDQPLDVEPVPADISTEQQVTPEPAPEVPQEPQSVAELQAEIIRLNEQLETSKSFIGRQSTDVGELRAEVDALRAQITTPQPVTPLAPQMAVTQELIDNDPAAATALAFQQAKRAAEVNGGVADPVSERTLRVAFDAWKAEDEFVAGQWLTDRRLEQQREEFDGKIAAVRGEVEQATAPIVASAAANAEQASWGAAFLEMQKAYPDFLEVDAATGKTTALRLLEEVAPQFPTLARLIAEGDVAAKVEGLTLLYDKGKLGNPAQMAAELQSAADEAAASAERARAAAASVNGQDNAGQNSTVELTEEQAEIERYKARYSGGVSLARGWTGRG